MNRIRNRIYIYIYIYPTRFPIVNITMAAMAVKKRFNACHLVQTTRLYFESKRMLHLSVNRGKRIIKHANKSDCSTKRDAIKEFSLPFFFFFFLVLFD